LPFREVRDLPLPIRNGRSGHTIPFIAQLTRAYLNFEVKDAPKARGHSKSDLFDFDTPKCRSRQKPRSVPSRSLSSKLRYAFLPPSEEWITSRESREVKPHQRPRGPAKTVVDRLGQTFPPSSNSTQKQLTI
jgi:hypothetical protein